MAVFKLFPQQDTTIYSAYPVLNAGSDAILEISNTDLSPSFANQVTRTLIKFNQDEINEVLDKMVSGSNFEAHLKTYIAEASGILKNSTIEAYPIYGNWINGEGMFGDSPENVNGASWVYKDYYGGNSWPLTNLPSYVKNSYVSGSEGGGNWFTGSDHPEALLLKASQSFESRLPFDLDMNITNDIKVWYSSSKNINGSYNDIPNNGLVLKWEDSLEFNTTSSIQPSLKFYSIDTNTIYPPTLEIRWDDSKYNTGSLPLLTTADAFIGVHGNAGTFYPEDINKFRVNARPMYPPRVYQTSSIYTNNYALPTSSYWAIKDLTTNERIVDFDDNFTKISCDASGSYFTLYFSGLEPDRNYAVLIKTIINGETIIEDDNFYFKVVQ